MALIFSDNVIDKEEYKVKKTKYVFWGGRKITVLVYERKTPLGNNLDVIETWPIKSEKI